MSATIMDILKKIQSDLADQKEYMQNLHVIHNNINEKFTVMESKLDQQQVTIERLEKQVRKNNLLIFGNDETVVGIEDKTMPEPETLNMESYQDKLAEEHIDCAGLKPNNLENDTEAAHTTGTLNNGEHELAENDKDKSGDSIAIASELREIKDIIRDYVTSKSSVDPASLVRKQEAVLISVDSFNSDQISKLNGELKQIAEKYQSTNIFPVIEVTPGPFTHHVMEQLLQGVHYRPKSGVYSVSRFHIKLGTWGFRRHEILSMLKENPTLSLADVVKNGLLIQNQWNDISQIFDLSRPFIGCSS